MKGTLIGVAILFALASLVALWARDSGIKRRDEEIVVACAQGEQRERTTLAYRESEARADAMVYGADHAALTRMKAEEEVLAIRGLTLRTIDAIHEECDPWISGTRIAAIAFGVAAVFCLVLGPRARPRHRGGASRLRVGRGGKVCRRP